MPFALLYWLIVVIRNWLYDKKIFSSTTFGLPLICVGNLSVGGTGKSPMVELLVEALKKDYLVATLSRGYKRKTKGYALANDSTTALEIGDEPMQFHLKFPDVPVAVGEERILAIPQLLHDKPGTQAIILDDAFQHRAVTAGLNILLTDYNNLFTRDFYLPTGDLRDIKGSYKRADIIVVTKCKPELDPAEREKIIREIKPVKGQDVYFTTIEYSRPYHIISHERKGLDPAMEVLLVTGIANPRPLKKLLEGHSNTYQMLQYGDHHIFSIDDLRDIRQAFQQMQSRDKLILTTEKDAVRLLKFREEIKELPLYVLPVKHRFLFEEEMPFLNRIHDFIKNFKKEE